MLMPRLKTLLLVEIERVTRNNAPVRVLPHEITVDLLPLGVTLKGVKIAPQGDLDKLFDPLVIDSASARVSLWMLLQGKLRLSSVAITGARVKLRIPKSEKKSERPLAGIFQLLDKIPVSNLSLNDVDLDVELGEPSLLISVHDLQLNAEKHRDFFSLAIERSQVKTTDRQNGNSLLIDFAAGLIATPSSLAIENLQVRRGDSYFEAATRLQGKTEDLQITNGEGSARGELQIESMRTWVIKTFPRLASIPIMKGRAFFAIKATNLGKNQPDTEFNIRTEEYEVLKFHLGKIDLQGQVKNGRLKVNKGSLENSATKIALTDIDVALDNKMPLTGRLAFAKTEMHDFLKAIHVGDIPTYAKLTMDVPCSGELRPFRLKCVGELKAYDLVVKGSTDAEKSIVAGPELFANGWVEFDKDYVNYDAGLRMANSQGRSSGKIGYATGFDIAYEADNLSTKDLSNLINLRIEGDFKIKGTTTGTTQHGEAKMHLAGKDVWFENYLLGNVATDLSYKNGIVDFAAVKGFYSVSRYEGDIRLNLLGEKTIAVNARLPFFDMKDFTQIFSRRVKFPFVVAGTGQGLIAMHGPLQFNALTYDLKSSLFKGTIAGEPFDQVNFDLKAVKGEVKAERVQILKGKSIIALSGVAHPSGDVECVVNGRGLRLEDTAAIRHAGIAVSGIVDFDMDLSSYILAPDADMKGSITKMLIGEQPVPDSSFKLRFNKKSIQAEGAFLGDVLHGELMLPYDSETPFKLKLDTLNWNFAPVIAALIGAKGTRDYEGKLTSSIEIASPAGGFWNATGHLRFNEFALTRGSLFLKSPEPLSMTMKNGQLRVDNFVITGGNTFLKLVDNPNPSAKVDMQVNGKLDLNLLGLLTPFFEDLRGMLSFAFNFKGGDKPSELLGSAYIERGFLKFFNFVHPFENIQMDLAFNQKKVLFNSIRSEFGGGKLSGSGTMELRGFKDYPVNLALQADKVTLLVPAKIKTTGSGNFTFTGSWFPFLLKGDYTLSDGLFSKEFGGDGEEVSDGIRRDNYLPEALLEESFVPLLVDLKISLGSGLPAKNELIDGKALGNLTVRGNPTKAAIGGTLTTDKDFKINFRETQFEVVSSNIQFADSIELNPKIYIAARSRVQDYDVNLLLQGTGQHPELSWSSIPPLAEKDIISLLALGATDSQLDNKIASRDQGQNTAQQVASGIAKKNPISNAIKDKLGFDVQFSPGYDDTNSSTQKVIVSRQFSPKLGVQASQSFGKSRDTEAKVRYRLTEKISVVGSWEGRDYSESGDQVQTAEKNPNKVGLDVEYKFEFK